MRRKATSGFKIDCWVGDTDAFARLVKTTHEIVEDGITRAHASLRASEEAGKAAWLDRLYYIDDGQERAAQWEAHLTEKLHGLATGLQLSLTATHKRFDQEMSGDPDEVLNALELDDLKKISLEAGSLYGGYNSGGYGLRVSFERAEGVQVSLAAPDNDWIMLANEKLRLALLGKRPWYWWLRRIPVVAAIFFIPLMVLCVRLLIAGSKHPDPGGIAGFAIAFGLVLAWLAVGLALAFRLLLPAFELLPRGSSGRGARYLAIAASCVAWIGGIVVPLYLK
jgi:hypothetical protein